MARVDIAADLNSEDEAGFVWTFLDEAEDDSLIRPGEVVIAGTPADCGRLRGCRSGLQAHWPGKAMQSSLPPCFRTFRS